MTALALVALGSNVANATNAPVSLIKLAVAALTNYPTSQLRLSRLFSSPAVPAGSGPDFVNTAVAFRTSLSAQELLAALHEIEERFGRERTERWGPRTLDLDLIAYDQQIRPDAQTHAWWRMLHPDQQTTACPEQLILPHPRLQDRAFVLVPLMDIAPDWRHPALGLTIAQMHARLRQSDIDALTPLAVDISA